MTQTLPDSSDFVPIEFEDVQIPDNPQTFVVLEFPGASVEGFTIKNLRVCKHPFTPRSGL